MLYLFFILTAALAVVFSQDATATTTSNGHTNNEDDFAGPIENTSVRLTSALSNFTFGFAEPRLFTSDRHAPKTTNEFLSEYDYIVVGSGPGGATVAARLSEIPCVKVLLLEAGKIPPRLTEVPGIARVFFGSDIDWRYLTVPQSHTGAALNNRQVAFPSGKAVGGSSTWNAMLYVRGHRQNFDDWARNGATGWSYEEVLPYFKKMEKNLNPDRVEKSYHGFDGPVDVEIPRYHPTLQKSVLEAAKSLGIPIRDINGRYQRGFYPYQAMTGKGKRSSAAKAYLVPADNRTNLHIVSNAFVTKVLIENDTAIGVLLDHGGEKFEVRARREVIVSAGTVNSAQLLMLSGIGPKAHLENLHIPLVKDLPVGKNLQDHCAVAMSYVISNDFHPYLAKLLDPVNIKRYFLEGTGPLAASEGMNTFAFLTNNPTSDQDVRPDHQIYFLESVNHVLKHQTNIKQDFYEKVYSEHENSTQFLCISQILHPLSRGTVTLRSADPHDPPFIDPNYMAEPQDVEDIVAGLKACNRIAETEPMLKIGTRPLPTTYPGCEQFSGDEDAYLTCIARLFVITLSHQVGTAKMGSPDDPTAAVDPKLRVLGIKGLRVVDASVMPIVTSGNTASPTFMIAEKAADMIKETITCAQDTGYLK